MLKDYTDPRDILGEHGLLKQLTKRVVERVLEAELTAHLGYAPHVRHSTEEPNARNGKGQKTVSTFHAEGVWPASHRGSTPYPVGRHRSWGLYAAVSSESALPRTAAPSQGGLPGVAAQQAGRMAAGHGLVAPVPLLRAMPPLLGSAGGGLYHRQAALHMARTGMGRRLHSTGHHVWARGYSVATVGREAAVSRESIRPQAAEERRLEHMALW